MAIQIDAKVFPWKRAVVSTSPHFEGSTGVIVGRGFSDRNVLVRWDIGNSQHACQTWTSVDELDWKG